MFSFGRFTQLTPSDWRVLFFLQPRLWSRMKGFHLTDLRVLVSLPLHLEQYEAEALEALGRAY